MSYPAQRYFGHSGEVTARFRPSSAEPDHISAPMAMGKPAAVGGTSYHYLATMNSTEGDFGLYRVDMAAGAGGPAMHFHKTMSESFFVLDGTLRLHDGSRWLDGQPGDFLYVPPGGLHAFRNESDAPVSMLMLFAPGAPREAYFEGITEIASLADDERARFLIEHDSYFT